VGSKTSALSSFDVCHAARLRNGDNNCHRRLFSSGLQDNTTNHGEETTENSSPWKIAIVGSGPSGCYTAKYLVMGAKTKLPKNQNHLSIDIIERLPTAYGLVRNGVAPDHPEVKNVQHDFDELFDEGNSDGGTIRFFGNVTVGGETEGEEYKDETCDGDKTDNRNENNNASDKASTSPSSCDVTLDELRKLYDVVVLAYGCESDRELNLPIDIVNDEELANREGVSERYQHCKPSDIKGVLSAREFVNWYNGHPEYEWVTHEVVESLYQSHTQDIVVIGHGNVALDCSRILAKARVTLNPTDLTTRALEILRPNELIDSDRTISVVGRRGHVQAAFTIKEIRELTKLTEDGDNANLILRKDELEEGSIGRVSKEELKQRPRARIHKLLQSHAKKQNSPTKKDNGNGDNEAKRNDKDEESNEDRIKKLLQYELTTDTETPTPSTNIHLRFLTNPVRFEAQRKHSGDHAPLQLTGVVCEKTKLVGDTPGKQSAEGTGVYETIPANLCLVSIGYRGLAIDACTREHFNDFKGILKNKHGRVVGAEEGGDDDNLAPLYVSGWLKRGPSGIIGTNIGDAKDTVVSILEDLACKSSPPKDPQILSPTINNTSTPTTDRLSSLQALLEERNVEIVDWESYRNIEAVESAHDKVENKLGHCKRHPDQPREKIIHHEQLLKAAKEKR